MNNTRRVIVADVHIDIGGSSALTDQIVDELHTLGETLVPRTVMSDRGPDLSLTVEAVEDLPGSDETAIHWTLRGLDLARAGRGEAARELDEAMSTLYWAVACQRGPWLFVHAGAVTIGGEALLLPGRSFAGKSTLVRALIDQGASYFSDEYACISATGEVAAFPRPIRLRSGKTRRRVVPIRTDESMSAADWSPTAPARWIVFSNFEERRSSADLRPIGHAEAIVRLLDNTVRARSELMEATQRLRLMADGVTAFRLMRGEADDAAQLLLRRLGSKP